MSFNVPIVAGENSLSYSPAGSHPFWSMVTNAPFTLYTRRITSDSSVK
ncbi:MAG: hypothetical protein IPN18_11715 [Ignavibacteriales bacterium]|nr:hypothetical protein [Ignavibacteriales bacterium]